LTPDQQSYEYPPLPLVVARQIDLSGLKLLRHLRLVI
jgi:hypothetical protein